MNEILQSFATNFGFLNLYWLFTIFKFTLSLNHKHIMQAFANPRSIGYGCN